MPDDKRNITYIYQHGLKIYVRLDKSYQDIKVINEVIQADQYGLEELAEEFTPQIVVDIGGHIGAFGLFAKKLWPDCNLYAVEPLKENCELYKRNMQANNYTACIEQVAVSCNPANQYLMHASRTTGGGHLTDENTAQQYSNHSYRYFTGYRKVAVRTLENLVNKWHLDRIDLLKLDVEGAEWDIIENLNPQIANSIYCLVGEYHSYSGHYMQLQPSPLALYKFHRLLRRKFRNLILDIEIPQEDKFVGVFRGLKCPD